MSDLLFCFTADEVLQTADFNCNRAYLPLPMQLHHCTGQCFFGPTKYPGRRPSTIEVFERNEFTFFSARTPPVQTLNGRLHRSNYPHMAPQCWQPLTFGCAAQKAVVSNAYKTLRQDLLCKVIARAIVYCNAPLFLGQFRMKV